MRCARGERNRAMSHVGRGAGGRTAVWRERSLAKHGGERGQHHVVRAAQSCGCGFCRAEVVANLFICDTSVFVTGTGLNPTLTAMAIADRAVEHIVESTRRGEL